MFLLFLCEALCNMDFEKCSINKDYYYYMMCYLFAISRCKYLPQIYYKNNI